MAPNALAYIATSQKGMACTLGTPSVGVFSSFSLILAKISPQPFLASRGQPRGGGEGRGGSTHSAAARNTPIHEDVSLLPLIGTRQRHPGSVRHGLGFDAAYGSGIQFVHHWVPSGATPHHFAVERFPSYPVPQMVGWEPSFGLHQLVTKDTSGKLIW